MILPEHVELTRGMLHGLMSHYEGEGLTFMVEEVEDLMMVLDSLMKEVQELYALASRGAKGVPEGSPSISREKVRYNLLDLIEGASLEEAPVPKEVAEHICASFDELVTVRDRIILSLTENKGGMSNGIPPF